MLENNAKIKGSYGGSHSELHSEEGTPCFCRSRHAMRCVGLPNKVTARSGSLAGP
jgi:hypothetical protein